MAEKDPAENENCKSTKKQITCKNTNCLMFLIKYCYISYLKIFSDKIT